MEEVEKLRSEKRREESIEGGMKTLEGQREEEENDYDRLNLQRFIRNKYLLNPKSQKNPKPSTDSDREESIFKGEAEGLVESEKDRSDKSLMVGNDDRSRIRDPSTINFITILKDSDLDLRFKLNYFCELIGNVLILPFLNGMMLGFGEITARELVGYYLGWGPSRYRYRYNENDLSTSNLNPSTSKTSSSSSSSIFNETNNDRRKSSRRDEL